MHKILQCSAQVKIRHKEIMRSAMTASLLQYSAVPQQTCTALIEDIFCKKTGALKITLILILFDFSCFYYWKQ